MPRNSQSNSRSSSPSRPSKTLPTYAPPPKIWHSSSTLPAPQRPITVPERPTLGQTMKEGFGFGVGIETAKYLMGSFFGTRNYSTAPPQAPQPQTNPAYEQCLEFNKDFPDVCKPFLAKEPSSWKKCMEMNHYQSKYCNESPAN